MAEIVDVHIKDYSGDVIKAVNEKISLALAAMGETVEGYAKEECPVDTGLLRNSITYALSGKPTNISSYSSNDHTKSGSYSGNAPDDGTPAVYVGSNVEYAQAVEFKDMSHRVGKAHFLRDGGQNHIPELKDKAEKILSAI